MLRRMAALAVVLAALLASGARAATPSKVQFQVDGLAVSPTGSMAAAGDAKLSDLFGMGAGASVAMVYRPQKRYGLGVRATWSRNAKDERFQFDDANGLPFAPGQAPPPGTYDAHRSLFSIPIEGFAEVHFPIGSQWALRAEAGAGLTSATERVTLSDAAGSLFAITGYQKSFTYGLGLSVESFWIPRVELQTGVVFHHAITEDGDVWSQGDHPALLAGTVGIRFPRH